MILPMALRHPIVSALAILSFGSILLFVADIMGSISAWWQRGRPLETPVLPQVARWISTALLLLAAMVVAAVLVVAAFVLFVALSSRYYYCWWTTLAVEAVGWASLAYFSYEAGISKAERPGAERQGDDQSTTDDAGNSDDSQATVSAEAEDAFQDVLLELKGRFAVRSVHAELYPRLRVSPSQRSQSQGKGAEHRRYRQ
jgi:hypothetical protein